mgnify:CR=1 FL=1
MNCTAIILAAGMSSRMKGTDKQLLSIDGIPVIVRSAMNFQNTSAVSEIIIAAKGEFCADIEAICRKAGVTKLKAVCAGGETRAKSAEAAFLLAGETEVTLIHDGARPFASSEIRAFSSSVSPTVLAFLESSFILKIFSSVIYIPSQTFS